MATLRIKFCGLCMFVPDGQRVAVLMPAMGHVHMEPHVARLFAPRVPSPMSQSDYTVRLLDGRELEIGSGISIPEWRPTLPKKIANVTDVAKNKIPKKLLKDSDARLAARVGITGGQCHHETAPGNFHFNGSSPDLAHIIEWHLDIADDPANEKELVLPINDLGGKEVDEVRLARGVVDPDCFDIQVHYEPESHLPFGGHTPSIPTEGMIATHFLAFYNLVDKPKRVELPVCNGVAKTEAANKGRDGAAPKNLGVLGSDPVTCVHSGGGS